MRLLALAAGLAIAAWPRASPAHVLSGPIEGPDVGKWMVLALLLLALVLHAVGSARLGAGARGAPTRRRQRACFTAGAVVLAACLLPPIDSWSAELFSAHMVQHELLMLVAAPLLVIGRPLPVMLWGLGHGTREGLAQLARSRAMRSTWRFLTDPAAGWIGHALALWVWHVPAIFRAALENPWLHELQHFTFVVTALSFWSGLLLARTANRTGAAVLYLFTTTVHTGVLGALITFASQPWYAPVFRSATLPEPLWDQQLGGLIMWVPGSMIYVAAGLLLLLKWVRDEAHA